MFGSIFYHGSENRENFASSKLGGYGGEEKETH
jgi:hypothetical protein